MNDGGSQGGQQFSLTASKGAKGVGSRTAILDGKTIWSEDDKIYVSSEDGRVTGVLKLDPNSLSEDKTTATFTGFVFGDPAKLAYSVFPAPTNGNIIDLSTIEGGKEVDAPFIGRINTNDDVDVRFDHVCGVAPVIKNNYQGGDIAITATNDNNPVKFLSKLDVTNVEFINGKPEFIIGNDEIEIITITSPKGGQMYVPYYLKSTLTANGEGKKIVEFKHGNDVVNNADLTDGFVGKVHATTVVAHTMKEDGTTVQNTSTESILSADEKTALVDQNQFSSINSEESATSEETQYFNVSGLVEKTEEGKTQNVVAEAVEVTLPKVDVSEGNEDVEKSVEISFTNVTSSTTITIKEEAPTTGSEQQKKSIDNLTVVLPSGTTAEEAKEAVNINMPNTTVTVKSDDGQILLIENMTAATADNTLVVGADVEIKSLTIKKGKVQVFGKVGEIKRDSKNEDEVTVVTIEKGGIVNSVNGKDEISVVDKNKGDLTTSVEVSTFTDFKAALDNENISNIILIKPIEVRGTLNIGSRTISLCKDFFTKNETEAAIITKNNVTITGTKGSAKITGSFNAKSNYIIRSEGDLLTINGVIVEAIGQFNALCVFDGILTIANRTNITSTGGYALDMISEGSSANANINDGSVVTGKVHYLLNSKENSSSFVVNNSSVTGAFSYGGEAGLNMLKITKSNGGSISGNNWPKGATGNEGSEEEGEPVANLTELTTALENPDVQNILLTAPITISDDLDLMGKTLKISDSFFTDNPSADAAITVSGNEKVAIQGSPTGKIQGYSDVGDRYIIKATSDFEMNEVNLIAENNLLGVKVVDADFSLTNSTMTNEINQILGVTASASKAAVVHMSGSTITGMIYINNEYEDANDQGPTALVMNNNSTINGEFIVGGSKSGRLLVQLNEGCTINSELIYEEEGLAKIRVTNAGGTINDSSWSESLAGDGEGEEGS